VSAAIKDFATLAFGRDSDYGHCVIVTPNDTTDLVHCSRGIMLGTAGNVTVDTEGGESNTTIAGLNAGVIHRICVTRVYNTGTNASNIAVFW
jgi:hypothetical protein